MLDFRLYTILTFVDWLRVTSKSLFRNELVNATDLINPASGLQQKKLPAHAGSFFSYIVL